MSTNIHRVIESLNTVCSLVDTHVETKTVIGQKVQEVLSEARVFQEDPSVRESLVRLEVALNSQGLAALSEKVRGVVAFPLNLQEKKSDRQTVAALDRAIASIKRGNSVLAAREGLVALRGVRGLEDVEVRRKILELKLLVEKQQEVTKKMLPGIVRNTCLGFSSMLNMAHSLLHPQDWHSSEVLIKDLLEKEPERFGLNPEQLYETAQRIIE